MLHIKFQGSIFIGSGEEGLQMVFIIYGRGVQLGYVIQTLQIK